MAARYSLGCLDEHGNPIGDEVPIGEDKNRIFDPKGDPRYAATLPLPSEITLYNPQLGLTHLRFVSTYTPRPTDRFVSTTDGGRYQRHTIVVQVGALVRGGVTVASRDFGQVSEYNRQSMPREGYPPAKAIAETIDIGCQNCEQIVTKHRFVKKVIFMLSEKAIYENISKMNEWLRNGFPAALEGGLQMIDFHFLHTNITHLEAKGVDVLFWLVKPEYLVGPLDNCNDYLNQLAFNPPSSRLGLRCPCANCIVAQQHRELTFALTGKEPCPCDSCHKLVRKYGGLKKGETFPLTTNAEIEVLITMEVDGECVTSSTDGSHAN